MIHLPPVHLVALLDGRGAGFNLPSGHHLADHNAGVGAGYPQFHRYPVLSDIERGAVLDVAADVYEAMQMC